MLIPTAHAEIPIAYASDLLPLHEKYDFLTIKNAVIAEFGTSSIMVNVARCESTFRQYDTDDNVLNGYIVPDDKGIFQINEYYHLEKAKKIGYDIYTVNGNIKYARYLYDHYGLQPWSASKWCWGQT